MWADESRKVKGEYIYRCLDCFCIQDANWNRHNLRIFGYQGYNKTTGTWAYSKGIHRCSRCTNNAIAEIYTWDKSTGAPIVLRYMFAEHSPRTIR